MMIGAPYLEKSSSVARNMKPRPFHRSLVRYTIARTSEGRGGARFVCQRTAPLIDNDPSRVCIGNARAQSVLEDVRDSKWLARNGHACASALFLDKLHISREGELSCRRPLVHISDRFRIFISYARDDDEAFAKELWRDLEEQGVRVWWDREAMASRGLTFLQEIRDAIASVERVLLIVGPRARLKPYVEVEWRHALRDGCYCHAVAPAGRLRRRSGSAAVVALRGRSRGRARSACFRKNPQHHCYSGSTSRAARRRATPADTVSGADRTVGRSANTRVLIDAYEPIDLEADQRITSITGMGGVGKSVLAAALAQAPEVRRSFADGIFWITVGRDARHAAYADSHRHRRRRRRPLTQLHGCCGGKAAARQDPGEDELLDRPGRRLASRRGRSAAYRSG